MIRSLGEMIGGSIAFWLVISYPAFRWGGESALVFSAVALVLCLVPTAATLWWAASSFQGPPEPQLVAVMGGMGVRVLVVLGGGMALYFLEPYFHQAGFWIWVVVAYLFTLTLEIVILLGRHQVAARLPNR